MRKILFSVLALFLCVQSASAAVWPAKKPKVVVVIVIDQFRADYLSRFQSQFSANGFRALMNNGAYFPYGEYDILQSMTGPGHATILTGSYPYQAGIPINDWYDQKTRGTVYCVEDPNFKTVGAPGKPNIGTSPKNLVGTTVGDEMKNAGFEGRVVSLALKDRAAILMGGHRADLAMWFDSGAKKWVSSEYYLKDGKVPAWMGNLNAGFEGKVCDLATPCGTARTAEAFQALFNEYKIGQGKGTDLIAVSFSSHDYAGHKHGANSTELEQMTLSEDKAIAETRAFLQKRVPGGLANVTFVLTGDHGVSPSPDYLAKTGIATGRINEDELVSELEDGLVKKFGKAKNAKWITSVHDFNFYLDVEGVAAAKLELSDVQNEVKRLLQPKEWLAQVFTQSEWETRKLPPGQFERQINKTFYRGRSGHVIAIQKPFYINASKNAADHMTGYTYDRTVPILFSGFGIKNGVFGDKAEIVDIAPTLSFLVGVIPPALSEGKVLVKALK
nr:Type I phosphodiesterase/nucleotide pyrophosphatase [uncultured organism]